jgi:cytosine/adenosine deaminase-related metal-dependent hydrolase
MPHVYRAAWVLPIVSPPIRDGWVAVEDGRVVGVGVAQTLPERAQKLPDRGQIEEVILPGLANAHTHLELSWMKGRVPPGDSMPVWAQRLIDLRRSESAGGDGPILDAIADVRASGTALVGDVMNGIGTYDLLAKSPLFATAFYELLGFNPALAMAVMASAEQHVSELTQTDRVRLTIVPHAPYSVSPGLFQAIASAAGRRPVTVHLGESPDEILFLKSGTGHWRTLLERLGAWNATWTVPACGPVNYLDSFGLLNDRLIAVHGVQLTDAELARLASAGATVVTCPRSNRWTGVGNPPVARFYASGVRVAIGTDSLASAPDLNLFHEMAVVRELAPEVSARAILRSATLEGARALGFGDELGAIHPGARAELIAVRIPPGLDDVEEYLVRGVQPSDVRWVNA